MTAKVTWNPEKFQARLVAAANAGLTAAAAHIAGEAKRNMGSEGGGVLGRGGRVIRNFQGRKIGQRPKLTRTGRQRYVSAPPGAFPGVRLGNLRRSLTHVTPEELGTPLRAAYGTNVDYGRHLEFGTRKMAARPWAMRSALQAQGAAHKIFAAEVRAVIAEGVAEQRGTP